MKLSKITRENKAKIQEYKIDRLLYTIIPEKREITSVGAICQKVFFAGISINVKRINCKKIEK